MAIAMLGGTLALEVGLFGPRAASQFGSGWLIWAVAIPCYVLLQISAEGILGAFWESASWVARAVPVVILVVFYVAWFVYAS